MILFPGRGVLKHPVRLGEFIGRIREGEVLVIPDLHGSLIVRIRTDHVGRLGVHPVLIDTDPRVGVQFLQGERLDFRSTGHGPALAVESVVVGELESQFAATLVIEVRPGGGAADFLQMGTATYAVDILGGCSGVSGSEVSLGTRYLETAGNMRIGNSSKARPLSVNTRARIFTQFNTLLNKAVRSGCLEFNPIHRMERSEKPKPVTTSRSFLTLDELRRLEACPIGPERVRKAFLFSCFCGLRWSDVKTLSWEDVKKDGKRLSIAKRMVKTGEWGYTPLNGAARSCLPPKKGNSLVFSLPTPTAANADLKRWAEAAGIRKKVTFHTARHTFATLLLTFGADIYTTSKLLGHTSVTTTQIYADVVDEKKEKAVRLLDRIIKKEV